MAGEIARKRFPDEEVDLKAEGNFLKRKSRERPAV